MPFPYRFICDLLQHLDDELRKPLNKQTPPEAIIKSWFRHHRSLIDESGNDACAILSMLLPERRTDRVYNIQAQKLQSIFGKALKLGASRVRELRRCTESGSGVDLADCVESALRQTPNSRDDTTHLSVEEIDETLGFIASCCRFSSPAVRATRGSRALDTRALLSGIFTRLGSRDAKWFTRLVLKNYQPVVLNANAVFSNYHPLLPQMMKIRDDLSVATAYVRHIDVESNNPSTIANMLKPNIGTKVGRQVWLKGRSIKHCMDMTRGRDIGCEQKIDGEYCQIHVDLRNTGRGKGIQIFSKSGKDSTADRVHLLNAIMNSLKLRDKDCPLAKCCILEGELVVYSTKEDKILPFHKIRKHVSRSGSFIGTANDSQTHEYERLMIVYYDVLLIDDQSLLGVKNSERFRRLSEIITCRKGYAELVPRTTIHTSRPSSVVALRELFAQCIASGNEGLVLKPDEPYFNFDTRSTSYGCCSIKLKKEYVQGLGDIGDFAVIGASYDASKAREYQLPNVKWTHFFIGCLENSDQARAKSEMPRFRVTNIVELTGPVLSAFWDQHRPISVPYEDNTVMELSYSGSILAKRPTAIFPNPLVFDMRCYGFDKEPNTNFWSMRFPQVAKVHHDRSYLDTISFTELQEIAETATHRPDDEHSQDMRHWVKALENIDRGKFLADIQSQATTVSDVVSSESSAPSQSTQQEQPSRHDLPTPPTSSAVEAVVSSEVAKPNQPRTPPSRRGKRSVDESSKPGPSSKRRRGNSGPSLTVSSHSQEKTPVDTSFARQRHREPLSQVDANASQKSFIASPSQAITISSSALSEQQEDISLPAEKHTPSSPGAYHTASEMASSSPPRTNQIRERAETSLSKGGTRAPASSPCCSMAKHECVLASCSILLSPCISSYALITEDLLKRHGVVDPLLDPRVWRNADRRSGTNGSSSRNADSSSSFACTSDLVLIPAPPPITTTTPTSTTTSTAAATDPPGGRRGGGNRLRKICLVESRRKDATRAFLQRIKDANLKNSRTGARDWVAVYDWRVLEAIAEMEMEALAKTRTKTKTARPADPWRKFYVGIT